MIFIISRYAIDLLLPLPLPLLLLSLLLTTVIGGNNIEFDPEADNTLRCKVAAYTDPKNYFKPKEGQCEEGTATPVDLASLDPNVLHNLAVAYAPVLFFHPLEKYTLSGVDITFEQPGGGKIYEGKNIVEDQLNMTTLLKTSRDPVWALRSSDFYFSLQERAKDMYHSLPDERFGDGYDEDGKSKARIYYNAYESGNGTWTFNYWLYYQFNGEGNMGVITTVPNRETKFTGFTLKPYGVHEGDWENLSVMVCPPNNVEDMLQDDTSIEEPLAIHYRQHSWGQITDCTKGECKFYKKTYHPVGFVALNSHATYPDSAKDLIYVDQPIGVWYNVQGFLVMDRTMYKKADGSYNYFMPETMNLERLQSPANLTLENEALKPYFWQGFGGNWGSKSKIDLSPEPPLCLAQDQQSFIDCPTAEEDPAFDLTMQLMGAREPSTGSIGSIESVSSKIADTFAATSGAPFGPAKKNYYVTWVEPEIAPFWEKVANISLRGQDYCTSKLDIRDGSSADVYPESLGTEEQINAMITIVLILSLLNILLPTGILMCCRPASFISEKDGRRTITKFSYTIGACVYTVFYVLTIVAGCFFWTGSRDLLDLLSGIVLYIPWDTIRKFVDAMATTVLFFQTVLFIIMWLQTLEMSRMIRYTQVQLSGSTEGEDLLSSDEKIVPWSPSPVRILFIFCFAILFLSLMLSMVAVLLGVAIVGFAEAFLQLCNHTVGSLDGVCLDLNFFGISKIACGSDFQSFCNEWARKEIKMVLWASFFVFLSHFYIIASTAFAFQVRRSVPIILSLLPNSPEVHPSESKPDNETAALSPVLEQPNNSRILEIHDSNASGANEDSLYPIDEPKNSIILENQAPIVSGGYEDSRIDEPQNSRASEN